jgi:uncharacterized membrane protein YfcA
MSLALSSLYPIAPAFLTAAIDIMFGMGFGLTMTPILILAGFGLHHLVPALLFGSLLGNALRPLTRRCDPAAASWGWSLDLAR